MLIDDLEIGELTKRIRIDRQTATSDGQGGQTIAWSTRDTCWASIAPISQSEAIRAGAVTSVLLSAITIWYRTDLDVTDRIVLGARLFRILSIQDPTGNQVALRIIVAEVQA